MIDFSFERTIEILVYAGLDIILAVAVSQRHCWSQAFNLVTGWVTATYRVALLVDSYIAPDMRKAANLQT